MSLILERPKVLSKNVYFKGYRVPMYVLVHKRVNIFSSLEMHMVWNTYQMEFCLSRWPPDICRCVHWIHSDNWGRRHWCLDRSVARLRHSCARPFPQRCENRVFERVEVCSTGSHTGEAGRESSALNTEDTRRRSEPRVVLHDHNLQALILKYCKFKYIIWKGTVRSISRGELDAFSKKKINIDLYFMFHVKRKKLTIVNLYKKFVAGIFHNCIIALFTILLRQWHLKRQFMQNCLLYDALRLSLKSRQKLSGERRTNRA